MTKSIVSITETPEFVTNATTTLQEYSDKPLYSLTISQFVDLSRMLAYQVHAGVTGENAPESSKYLTRKETAALLHISLPTLDKYTELGIIHGLRIGTRVLYKEDAVEEACKTIGTERYQR